MTELIINGVRHYKIDGRLFLADQYDRMFKPQHGIQMSKNKHDKGNNPCKKLLWMKDIKSY